MRPPRLARFPNLTGLRPRRFPRPRRLPPPPPPDDISRRFRSWGCSLRSFSLRARGTVPLDPPIPSCRQKQQHGLRQTTTPSASGVCSEPRVRHPSAQCYPNAQAATPLGFLLSRVFSRPSAGSPFRGPSSHELRATTPAPPSFGGNHCWPPSYAARTPGSCAAPRSLDVSFDRLVPSRDRPSLLRFLASSNAGIPLRFFLRPFRPL